MPHPYIIRRAEISGLSGLLCLLAGYAAVRAHNAAVPQSAGIVLLILAALLLGFAVYSQCSFGPPIRSVSAPGVFPPPHGFRAWLGILMFLLTLLVMISIVLAYFVAMLTKT